VGVLSRDDDPHFQQSSGEELKTKVEEAGRMTRVVAAHVHGKEGIMAALRDAGARDVHG
jgi:imidazolonepropionase-like amidohydrolase